MSDSRSPARIGLVHQLRVSPLRSFYLLAEESLQRRPAPAVVGHMARDAAKLRE